MGLLGSFGIIAAIILIIILSVKGYSIVVGALISSIVVIALNRMDLFSSLIGQESSYMAAMTNYLINFFLVFLLGAVLAKYMEISGAATVIAERIMQLVGTEKPFNVLVALFIISAVLSYGGISVFVVLFVLIPLALPIFKRLNIAWNLVQIPIFAGIGTFTMTMLPGSPAIQNVVPSNYLGTTLTAAPIVGIISSIGAIAFSLAYMKSSLRRSIAAGETFATYAPKKQVEDSGDEMKEEPSFLMSVIPIVTLIAIIFVGSVLSIDQVILIGLTVAIVVSGVLFRRFIPTQRDVLNSGVQNSLTPAINTSSAVAFGSVVTAAPGFVGIANLLFSIPGSPLISLSVITAALSLVTGSASGSLGIVMESFGETYLAMGIAPELIHRVAVIASAVTTTMPHSGIVLTFFNLSGLNHKNGFKYQFIVMTGANFVGLVIAILLGGVIY